MNGKGGLNVIRCVAMDIDTENETVTTQYQKDQEKTVLSSDNYLKEKVAKSRIVQVVISGIIL